MDIKLYPCFNHWKEMKNGIYLYSDPHFNDIDNQFMRKDYIGDKEQVKRINSRIGKNSVLIILGDVGDVDFVKQIKGYKVLIKGNHDKGDSNYQGIFNEIYGGPLFISKKIVLSHEPLELPYAINIHGHEHTKIDRPYSINVCAEHIDYIPISLRKALSLSIISPPSIHRLYIESRK